jgi:hypothetical protein
LKHLPPTRAEWLANRAALTSPDRRGYLATTRLPKSQVLAYTNGDQEGTREEAHHGVHRATPVVDSLGIDTRFSSIRRRVQVLVRTAGGPREPLDRRGAGGETPRVDRRHGR